MLSEASSILEQALIDARHSQTIVYSLSFDTPKQEYEYELKRNDSHQELVKVLIGQLNPEPATMQLVNQLVEQNRKFRADARSNYESGQIYKAIEMMEKGTGRLIQALRLGGLNLLPSQ